jgi:hypothetical protein
MQSEGLTFTLENRDVMASILGCSVRHLNRTLKALSKEKVIKVDHRTLKITDPSKLSDLALGPFLSGT